MKEKNEELVQAIGELTNIVEKATNAITFRLSELEKFIDKLSLEIRYLRSSLDEIKEKLSPERSKVAK